MRAAALALLLTAAIVGAREAYAARYYTLEPCRAIDTRQGALGGALEGGQWHTYALRGECQIPYDAKAVVLTFTAINSISGTVMDYPGHMMIRDAGLTSVQDSNLNWGAGELEVINSGLHVPMISGSHNVQVWAGYHPAKPGVNIVVDVVGYYR